MTEIRLYNTRTRTKEPFAPIDPSNVRMYVCGPTVYDRAHIGNARPVVVFDVLYRLLRHVYGEGHVTYVRNITDVDDKINARAAERGRPIREITEETLGWFHEDMAALGALPPTLEPRATEYIGPIIAMIVALIARGHAYEAKGHVLFSVASYPDYGKLAHRSLDEMRAGARVEVAPYKRDPMDFVLWKPSDNSQPGWDSPWGYGRPGWHIECSAMSYQLGPSFDIHGGGIDLAFPHHENEIAQSRCAHPEGTFANVWMHNGFLNVEGEKMSKSLGNFFSVWDLRQRMHGAVIRHVLLSTHYQSPLDWTDARVDEAKSILNYWIRVAGTARRQGVEKGGKPDEAIVRALEDNLDTPAALGRLHELAQRARPALDQGLLRAFIDSVAFLGFELGETVGKAARASLEGARETVDRVWAYLDAMAADIHAARQRNDFAHADRVRSKLEALGVSVSSTKEGTTWTRTVDFDATRIEALI